MNIEREVAYFGGTIETLAREKWKSMKVMRVPAKGINGYTYTHEEHSHGVGVAILPYSEGPAGMRAGLASDRNSSTLGSETRRVCYHWILGPRRGIL